MKRSELFFGAVLVPLDFIALLGAGIAAYYLRLSPLVQSVRPAVFVLDLPLLDYIQLVTVVSAVIVGIFALEGLYVMQVTRRLVEELMGIFSGISLGVMLVIVFMFLQAELFQSRFILLAAYVFGLIFMALGRYVVRRVQVAMLRRGYGVYRVALVGNSRYATQLAGVFKEQSQLGFRVVGISEVVSWNVLETLYREKGVDLVIQTDPTLPQEDTLIALEFCDKYKIGFKYVPNLFEAHAAHVRYRHLGGVPVMELMRTPLEGWGRVAKRVMDIAGALVGLVLLSPLLAVVSMAIELDSRGPVLYKQARIGRNKQPFQIYKFRSMYVQYSRGKKYGGDRADEYEKKLRQGTNERSGPLFKMKSDPRVTRVGRFIRRWRIDELPQFLNVLKGEMSLLGPRPHLPEEVDRYDKHHQKLFTIKPGMSGMAQVNGNAGLSFEQEASLDTEYIESWSLRLDVILLIKTFILLLTDKNAV